MSLPFPSILWTRRTRCSSALVPNFPIGYGLKVPEDAEKIGAYWEERRGIIHATGFTVGRIVEFCKPALRPDP